MALQGEEGDRAREHAEGQQGPRHGTQPGGPSTASCSTFSLVRPESGLGAGAGGAGAALAFLMNGSLQKSHQAEPSGDSKPHDGQRTLISLSYENMSVSEPDLIELAALIPDAVLDLRYATTGNFLEQKLYDRADARLRRPAAEKLARAAESLRGRGLRLVIYDAYRPLSAQRRMWALKPDRRYVADPARGSQHNRGAAVDVGLADAQGRPLAMPSEFDEFGPRAAHSYAGGDAAARANRDALRRTMEAAGFSALEEEWWHYADPQGREWPLLDV